MLRRLGTIVLGIATVGYGGSAAWLKINETALVYHPAARAVAEPAPGYELHQRAVSYRSGDGTRLSGWIVPARKDSSGYWLLICHGNFGNIGFGQRPDFYARMRDVGLNLLAFDYRGFGASEGSPQEAGLYEDAVASYHYLTDSLHVPADRIILFGHSLGSGVAIETATRVPAAALIVEGAYTSVPDRGQELYPYFPVKLIASQRFASLEKIGRVQMPKLFLHSPEDAVIPFAHGQALFAAATEPKRFVSVKGGHEDAFSIDDAKYHDAIRELIAALPSR